MALKKRKHSKFHNKFCNVVDKLIVLQELGFEEDGFHNWNYVIYKDSTGKFSKSIVASGDYLFLRDQQGSKSTDVNLCTLWNRDIGGVIKKENIKQFINLLNTGNVKQ
jgi:enolase